MPAPARRHFRWYWSVPPVLRKHPSSLLLAVQLLQIVLYPATAHFSIGRLLLGLASILVLLVAIWLIRRISEHIVYAASIAAVALVLNVVTLVTTSNTARAWQAALEALLYFYTARCMISYILANRRPTTDELVAAAATMTLLIWAFTELLVLCQLLEPNAFLGAGVAGDARSWSELMFLSFALFTNTGISVAMPLTAFSRAIGNLEMFTGIMYLALVVSRLIGQAANRGVKDN